MGSSQDSLGSWDERLQLATAMSGCKRAWLGALTRLRHNGVDSGPIERRNWLQPLVCSRGCWVIVFFRDSWSASRGGSAGMLGFCWGFGEAIR